MSDQRILMSDLPTLVILMSDQTKLGNFDVRFTNFGHFNVRSLDFDYLMPNIPILVILIPPMIPSLVV